MIHTHVAILGAGLAGLCVARRLLAAPTDIVLVEARDRLGGRILTTDGYDLGPSWYWPDRQPAMATLMDELGVRGFAQYGVGDVMFERLLHEAPQRFAGYEQEMVSMRPVGGTGALVRALARDIPQERVRLSTRVSALTLHPDGVELTLQRSDGTTEHLMATRVVAAAPPRLLAATVALAPALEAPVLRRWQQTPTWMAPHAKFLAVYDRAFWRVAGLSGTAQSMVGPMPEMHDASTASGGAALFGFVGIGAVQRRAMGNEALMRACVAQLTRLFGPEAASPRHTLFKDWAADPLTATADDQIATGHPASGEAVWVDGPWRERLVLAGSETSPVEPGYLAGAVTAAERAAAAVLRHRDGQRSVVPGDARDG